MISQHTPGPWTTDEKDHDAPYQDIKITAGKRHTVCTVWIDDAPVLDFNAEQNANARLIAAAPDLLEALKWVVRISDEGGYPDGKCLQEARTAIAKAGGAA